MPVLFQASCLVRPLDNEDDLAHIEFQDFESLKKPFKKALSHLIQRLYAKLTPVTIHGIAIDTATYLEMTEQYCLRMNDNRLPEIYTILEEWPF